MTRAVITLESLRSGRAGTILFYGYLIAILVGAIVLFHVSEIDQAQNNRIEKGATRSCLAIKGAGSFWREVRDVERLKLTDSGTSKVERAATAELLAALDRVIAKSSALQGDGDGK